jgi:hypothetical protein
LFFNTNMHLKRGARVAHKERVVLSRSKNNTISSGFEFYTSYSRGSKDNH